MTLVVSSCMTTLTVKTEVYDAQLSVSPRDVARAKASFARILDGVDTRAAELFRQNVLPFAVAFSDVFSDGARDPVSFGSEVLKTIEADTKSQRARVSLELNKLNLGALESKTPKANFWASEVEELQTIIDELETHVDEAVKRAVDARVAGDIAAVIEDYQRAAAWVKAVVKVEGDDEVQAAFVSALKDGETRTPLEIRKLASERLDSLAAFRGFAITPSNVDEAFVRLGQAKDALLAPVIAGVKEEINKSIAAAEATIVSAIDLSDPNIPKLVEDDRNWKSFVNKVTAFTFIGNSEIAIKMESLGEYHLKGVTVDNDGAAEAAFDVLGQTVSVLASAYGMPLAAPASAGADDENSKDWVSAPSGLAIGAATELIENKNVFRAERMKQVFVESLAIDADLTAAVATAPGDPAKLLARAKARKELVTALRELAGKIEGGS
ncbi:hypothetical protein [Planctomycetes bacterium Poly30]